MIIIGVVGSGEKRHDSLVERLKDIPYIDKEIREVGRWLGDPKTSKEKYYRDQIQALKKDGFNGIAVFTNVKFHDEFLALIGHGATMWHLASSISSCIPIRVGIDVLVSLIERTNRPHYLVPPDALHTTINRAIER